MLTVDGVKGKGSKDTDEQARAASSVVQEPRPSCLEEKTEVDALGQERVEVVQKKEVHGYSCHLKYSARVMPV